MCSFRCQSFYWHTFLFPIPPYYAIWTLKQSTFCNTCICEWHRPLAVWISPHEGALMWNFDVTLVFSLNTLLNIELPVIADSMTHMTSLQSNIPFGRRESVGIPPLVILSKYFILPIHMKFISSEQVYCDYANCGDGINCASGNRFTGTHAL